MTHLFEKRHYEWLAAFAAANLTPLQSNRLASELVATNPNFDRTRFLARVQERTAPDIERV